METHSANVAEAARRRGNAFSAGELAAAAGLFHDLGKMKDAFQARLLDSSIKVPHAADGARLAMDRLGIAGRFLAFGIAGHHGRMPNTFGAEGLEARLAGVAAPDPPPWAEIPAPALPERLSDRDITAETRAFRCQFLMRMIYSCLVEADDRETARYYAGLEGRTPEPEDLTLDPPRMLRAFDTYLAGLSSGGEINRMRREIVRHSRARASEPPGLFSMTVPTGGGKTLASLGFALEHAAAHGLRRLVYVIPYMSIIEQTAAVFRDLLGEEAVLEHHSTFDWFGAAEGDDDEAERLRRAAQSWDAPVVVTTAVQFFESLFANRKKRCRKLNALSEAVIVLDEAQTLPRRLLRPCLAALRELADGYGASVVLCTATQPALTKQAGFPAPEALDVPASRELAPDPPGLYAALRRTRLRHIGAQEDAALAERLRETLQALLIVDNRKQARALFDRIAEADGAAHLSTLMTPTHRRVALATVRTRLNEGRPARLVATSLVEAGVDVDFPLVLRAEAGLDSLAQAAGRCNREGLKEGFGEVQIFRPEQPPPQELEQLARIGQDILERCDDPLSLEAMEAYFRELYTQRGVEALDSVQVGPREAPIRGILNAIARAGLEVPFEDIAEAFQIIEGGQRALVVRGGRWGIPEDRLEALGEAGAGAVARGVQGYSINVPYGIWRSLRAARAISAWRPERFDEQFFVLDNAALYDDRAGLAVEGFEDAGFLNV
ncbi:MAG: CRISPR-associated endonuclease Cas3'' [Pseudomonadota bacterium]